MIWSRRLAGACISATVALSPALAMDRWSPAVRFSPQPGDASYYDAIRGVQFFRHVACQLSSNPSTPRAWPVAVKDRIGSGAGNAMPLISSENGNQIVTNIMLAHPMDTMSSVNVLVCRGSIIANGRDVTLYPADSSDVLVEPLGDIAKSGWPVVSPQLDAAKLAAIQSAGPAMRVHAEGEITLRPGDRIDFDTDAQQGTPPTEADLSFEGAAGARFLTPTNGAEIARADLSSSDCSLAKFSTTRLAYSPAAVPLGSYICMKTSHGHIVEFRIAGAQGDVLSIGYTTYE